MFTPFDGSTPLGHRSPLSPNNAVSTELKSDPAKTRWTPSASKHVCPSKSRHWGPHPQGALALVAYGSLLLCAPPACI